MRIFRCDACGRSMSANPDTYCPCRTEGSHETETYTEWRLRGQPPGDFPFYDLTFRDPERVASLRTIFDRSADRGWTDVTFESREVTITRTAWKEASE